MADNAKNRKVIIQLEANKLQEIRLDKLAESLPVEAFPPIQLNLDKPKNLWVATTEYNTRRVTEEG